MQERHKMPHYEFLGKQGQLHLFTDSQTV